MFATLCAAAWLPPQSCNFAVLPVGLIRLVKRAVPLNPNVKASSRKDTLEDAGTCILNRSREVQFENPLSDLASCQKEVSMSLRKLMFVITLVQMVPALAWSQAGTVKITPLGSRTGNFCVLDRALLFEDPTG